MRLLLYLFLRLILPRCLFDYDTYAVFYVDSKGSCVGGNLFCVGSGSTLAYAVMDESWDKLNTMGLDEVVDKAIWAVRHAAHRDSFSGGYINVIQINATGCHHIRRLDARSLRIPAT